MLARFVSKWEFIRMARDLSSKVAAYDCMRMNVGVIKEDHRPLSCHTLKLELKCLPKLFSKYLGHKRRKKNKNCNPAQIAFNLN